MVYRMLRVKEDPWQRMWKEPDSNQRSQAINPVALNQLSYLSV
jgi:hypothetical protein